jgi:hypothetical protein
VAPDVGMNHLSVGVDYGWQHCAGARATAGAQPGRCGDAHAREPRSMWPKRQKLG